MCMATSARAAWQRRLGHTLAVFVFSFTALTGASSGAGDWPQWRGAERDGSVAAGASGEWLERPVELWRREIGSGYSGPVVAGGFVFVHSRQGDEEVVASLVVDDGSVVWSRRYEAPFRQDHAALHHGRGPYSTPAVADDRLFTFGVTGILSAWDAATGKLLWRRESAAEFEPGFPYFGAAASPLVWNDLCFVHLGGHARGGGENPWQGAFVALGVADGGERWQWHDDGPAVGASPVVGEIGGRPHLVLKSLEHVIGLDPRTGTELWRIPYKVGVEEAGNTIVTPLFVGSRLLLSDWDMGVSAWLVRHQGESWAVHQLWHNRDVSLSMSSPVVAGGQVVGFSHFRRGQLFGLDPRTGALSWRGEPRSGEHASLMAWGDELLVLLEDGTLMVGKVARNALQTLYRHRVGRLGGWAHPAVAAGRLLIRDGSQLVVFRIVEQ